ncbi:MAG: DUF4276 family protein [Planctomycetes bacterium]|nr:DUF4276 family protein [Planctomycetota bacterium]
MRIVPIVEGHGEVEAVPVLLRRIAALAGVTAAVRLPIRVPRSQLVREDGLRRAVELAARSSAPGDPILVVLDADADCPAILGPRLLACAIAARADRPVAVVVARTEFESWYLAAAASLAAAGKLDDSTIAPADPEAVRGAKGWLAARMARRYSETLDQPSFAALFDLDAARGCPSFDKLLREVGRLLRGAPGPAP